MTKPIDTAYIRHTFLDLGYAIPDAYISDLCDEIDRLRGEQRTLPQGRTVRVRVAVAVNQNRAWHSVGWDGVSKKYATTTALNSIAPGGVVYWLTATLPVPQEVEVEAEVENGD